VGGGNTFFYMLRYSTAFLKLTRKKLLPFIPVYWVPNKNNKILISL
jgi:hypothetical protein